MAKQKKHAGTIEQRGGSYRVILKVAGVRHTFTLPGVSRRDAEEFADRNAERLREQANRARLGLPGAMPFSALLDRFEAERLPLLAPNTQRAYRGSLARFRSYFCGDRRQPDPFRRNPGVEEIRPGHVVAFMNWRRVHALRGGRDSKPAAQPASARTLQKDRAGLHAVFAFAVELELRESNPVARTTPPKADARSPVILSDEQYEALLSAAVDNPMLRLYVLALGETGGRCESEVLWLRWEDVDLEGRFLKIITGRGGHRTKGGRSRWVPMTPRLAEALREHFASYRLATYDGARTPWVFHHDRARRNAKAGSRLGSLRRAFLGAAERAKLPPGLHQHDLRHRRVTTWLAAGANPVHVKEAVGHADLRTTMGYTHLSREHLRSLVPEEPPRDDGREREIKPA
jgi:site-specific recombinase XerD